MSTRFLLLLLALLGLAPVHAHHGCVTWTTSAPEVDTGTLPDGSRYYVDQTPNVFGEGILGNDYWFYVESNGLDGLQRGDEVVDDTCHGMVRPDTIWL